MTAQSRLTAETLADLLMPADPAVSPDGRWLAATVTASAKKDLHRCASIWIADTSGETPARQLTAGTANDTRPRWSPDGRSLAFLSDRSKRETSQVHLLPIDGGEAREITDRRGGVSDLCWLPGDDRRIAYLAVDARDEAEQRRRDEERDDANVYGSFWSRARIVVRDLDSGDEQLIDTGDIHVSEIAPSPDGRKLAAVVSDTPEIDSLIASGRVVVVDLKSGATTEIASAGGWPSSLTWSRDGARVYFVAGAGDTPVASYQLWLADPTGRSGRRCVSEGSQYCFAHGGVTRATNEDRLLAVIARGTASEIHAIDPDSWESTTLCAFPGDISRISTSATGEVLGLIASTPSRPDELYAARGGREPRPVSDLNPIVADIALGPQEVLTWERAGVALDGILIWPPGKSREDGPMPCVVSIHGGPYGRWPNEFVTRFGRWIAQHGYLVFLPNPRGGAGHGQAFAESVLNTVGNDDYLDIISGVDLLVAQGLADPDRLGCGGWSQGGFMTAWIVGQTDRFKAGVMGAGVSDWGMMIATSDIPTYEQFMGGGNPYEGVGPHSFDAQSPASFVSRVKTPVLVVHGEKDERVPVTQGIHFFRGLRRYGVPTELVTYPREPHGIQERNHQIDLNRRIVEWFRRWIPVDSDRK